MRSIKTDPRLRADYRLDLDTPKRARSSATRVPRPRAYRPAGTQIIDWRPDTPEPWHVPVQYVGEVIRDYIKEGEGYHDMYLAIGGSMLKRGIEPELVPTLVWAIACAAESSKPESHRISAIDTVNRYARGLKVTGMQTLKAQWPLVGQMLDEALVVRPEASEPQDKAKIAETIERMRQAIRDSRCNFDKLVLIAAETGLGKTRALIDVTIEDALNGKKTVISLPTNELAKEVTTKIRERYDGVARFYGPLSVEGPGECIHRKRALPLVNGGQSLQHLFCKGKPWCDVYDTCKVREGVDGPSSAKIIVGNHALLGELVNEAGIHTKLCVDEPPTPVLTEIITDEDWAMLARTRDAFHPTYVAVMDQVVNAAQSLRDTVAEKAEQIFWFMDVSGAHPEGSKSTAPRLHRERVKAIVRGFKEVTDEGKASRIYSLLWDTLADMKNSAISVRYIPKSNWSPGAFAITRLDKGLEKAIRRVGAKVLLDANIGTNAKIYERIVQYKLNWTKFEAADGAPIHRMRIERTATRKQWLPSGAIDMDAFGHALRDVKEWIDEGPAEARYGLITFRTLSAALCAAQGHNIDDVWQSRWGSQTDVVTRIRAILDVPTLRRLDLGHYGAIRGLNRMDRCHGLITMGDPWANMDAVREAAMFASLKSGDSDVYLRAYCVDELEQAQGRLRVVHRDVEGRALHIGHVNPGGFGWARAGIRVERRGQGDGGGRPRNQVRTADYSELLRLVALFKSTAEASRCSGVPDNSLRRYIRQECGIPSNVLESLRNAAKDRGSM